jgi:hypothetical protein
MLSLIFALGFSLSALAGSSQGGGNSVQSDDPSRYAVSGGTAKDFPFVRATSDGIRKAYGDKVADAFDAQTTKSDWFVVPTGKLEYALDSPTPYGVSTPFVVKFGSGDKPNSVFLDGDLRNKIPGRDLQNQVSANLLLGSVDADTRRKAMDYASQFSHGDRGRQLLRFYQVEVLHDLSKGPLEQAPAPKEEKLITCEKQPGDDKPAPNRKRVDLVIDPRTSDAMKQVMVSLRGSGSDAIYEVASRAANLRFEEIPAGFEDRYKDVVFDPQCVNGKIVIEANMKLFDQLSSEDKAMALAHTLLQTGLRNGKMSGHESDARRSAQMLFHADTYPGVKKFYDDLFGPLVKKDAPAPKAGETADVPAAKPAGASLDAQ